MLDVGFMWDLREKMEIFVQRAETSRRGGLEAHGGGWEAGLSRGAGAKDCSSIAVSERVIQSNQALHC